MSRCVANLPTSPLPYIVRLYDFRLFVCVYSHVLTAQSGPVLFVCVFFAIFFNLNNDVQKHSPICSWRV